MAICEQCGKEHEGNFGSGRFCSRSCSNKWVALHQSPEAKSRKVELGKKNLEIGHYRTKEDMSPGELSKRREVAKKALIAARLKRWSNKSKKVLEPRRSRKIPIEDILSNKVKGYLSSRLKWRLVYEGFKELKCESCGLSNWLGTEIPIELHHKDGDRYNNNLDNLQILCPNCHAMTSNYRGKNIKSKCVGNSVG